MKINNNIQALNAYRNLNANQFSTSKNLEKLSSGLRINRAADDAAGLAISEKMRSQIRGLKMAERNSMDGISLMQTAEGAMQEVHAMLQRMRELAVQAANDTNTEYDRDQIQKEIDQLKLEIDSVSEKTEFNTRKLLNGSSAVLTVLDGNENGTNHVGDPKVVNPALKSGEYEVTLTGLELTNEIIQPSAGLGAEGDIVFNDPENNKYPFGEYTVEIRNFEENAGTKSANITVYGPDGLERGTGAFEVGNDADDAKVGGLTINASKIDKPGTVKVKLEAEVTAELWKEDDSGTPEKIFFDKKHNTNNGKLVHGGIEFSFLSNVFAGDPDAEPPILSSTTKFTLTNNALAFQIGANTQQNVMIDIPQMDIVELAIEDVNVTSNEGANKAISQLDHAINKLSEARAKLGATQNRMEHTINNLQVTHENLTASESRIRDADMALEMTEFTRNNIINQAATAMLAQANQLPQGVLQLLQ